MISLIFKIFYHLLNFLKAKNKPNFKNNRSLQILTPHVLARAETGTSKQRPFKTEQNSTQRSITGYQ